MNSIPSYCAYYKTVANNNKEVTYDDYIELCLLQIMIKVPVVL